MVKIDRVVTRGGDHGMTSLGDGSRQRKDTPRIEAIGSVDEANATIGWLRAAVAAALDASRPVGRDTAGSGTIGSGTIGSETVGSEIVGNKPVGRQTIEREIGGSEMDRSETGGSKISAMLGRIQNDLFDVGADLCVPGEGGDRLRLTEAPLLRLEAEIEAMNAALPALTSFILPGGSEPAARAHMARVVIRRAERRLIAVDGLNPLLQRYLNRLSDHLFVLSRVLNENGAADVLWQPGANR